MKKFFALFLILALLLPAMTLAKDKFAKVMEPVVKIGTAPVVAVWSGFEAVQVAKNHVIKAKKENVNIGKTVGKAEMTVAGRNIDQVVCIFKPGKFTYDNIKSGEENKLVKDSLLTNVSGWATIGSAIGGACGHNGWGTHASNWHGVQWSAYGKVIGSGVGLAVTCAEDKWGESDKLLSSAQPEQNIILAEVPFELVESQ